LCKPGPVGRRTFVPGALEEDPVSIADEILELLKRKRRLKLTAIDIAEMLYWGDKTCQQRVKTDCLMLYEKNRLVRDGRGSRGDPYVYSIAPIERRP
jgi:hypothetical protein